MENPELYLLRLQRQYHFDCFILSRLVKRLDGRISRPLTPRHQRFRSTLRRDPVMVAARYLRRFAKGDWYRGGSHVARLFGGPGIGFRNWRNDRAAKVHAELIRA